MKTAPWIKRASIAIVFVFLIAGGYLLYQHHLSGDVKRLLIAAFDEHASQAEVRGYVAQVRPLIRTTKDKQMVAQFERGLALLAQVEEDQHEDEEEFRQTLSAIGESESDHCSGMFYFYIHIRKRYEDDGVTVPKDVRENVEKSYSESKKCHEDEKVERERRDKREKSNRDAALQCFDAVRATLGLSPIPKEKDSQK